MYPRLGELHVGLSMSFSGSNGKLMMDSEIPKHAFGGVDKTLYDKKFPYNVRNGYCSHGGTRDLLLKHISDVETYDELDAMQTDISIRSGTALCVPLP